MPGMVGGFLRRNIYYFNNDELFVFGNKYKTGLFRVLYSNEGMAEGLMNRRNSQTNNKGESKRSENWEIYTSLTQVNFHFKIDSSTVIWVSYEWRVLKGKEILIIRNFIITSLLNINTGKDLEYIQICNLIIISLVNFNKVINQYGNLGQYWMYKTFNIQYIKITRIFVYVMNNNLYIIKIYDVDIYKLNGGKIAEKAKAKGNSLDIRNKLIIPSLFQTNTNYKTKSRPIFYIGKQNSVLHYNVNLHLLHKRNYSVQNPVKGREDNLVLWPSSEELLRFEKSVYEKQMVLVKQAEKLGVYHKEVMRKQLVLSMSYEFRIIAVNNLIHSLGSLTPGIDNEVISTKSSIDEKMRIVEKLKDYVKHSERYKASPVKRVYVPKVNGKMRPLGIPTIIDRGLQHLVKLVLDPIVEMNSDIHNYGFRRYRSAKNAIGILRAQFKTCEFKAEKKWILDADIKGFFDNINHDWLMKNTPLHKKLLILLKSWLKAGHIEKNVFHMSEAGTPQGQGGVISPVLANLTLNGLEEATYSSIYPLTRSKERRLVIKYKDGSKTRIGLYLFIVRYADDFVIIARSQHILKRYVLPKIKEFLTQRGLVLSSEKTKVYTMSDEKSELNFLGYTLKYRSNWKFKRSFIFRHIGERGIALYPNKQKVYEVIKKLRNIIKKGQNLTSYSLISLLNPIISGWANYYNIGNSTQFRDYIRQALWKMCWKWCQRKHKRWGKRKIAKYYFYDPSGKKFKGKTWTFYGLTKSPSIYKDIKNGKKIYLQDISTTNTILASKEFIIPQRLLNIHAYHPEYHKLIEFQKTLNVKSLGKYSPQKGKLMKRQNSICTICNKLISTEQMLRGAIHIHHVVPIFFLIKGGSRSSLKNMQLVHSWCHRSINHFKQPDLD
jgi:RNA-directed DNA polymerase